MSEQAIISGTVVFVKQFLIKKIYCVYSPTGSLELERLACPYDNQDIAPPGSFISVTSQWIMYTHASLL